MKYLTLVNCFIIMLKLFEKFRQSEYLGCEYDSNYADSTSIDYFRKLYERKLNESDVSKTTIKLQVDMLSLLRYFDTIPCGEMDVEPESSIVNGTDAPDKAWPWQAVVYSANVLCGGVLISDRWVLTAGHCFSEAERFRVEVGTRVLGSTGDVIRRVAELFVVHKGYSEDVSYDDIALIKMSSKVPFTDRVRPACLPLRHDDFNETNLCYITGFGLDAPGVNHSNTLQQLRVLVVPLKECMYFWSVLHTSIDYRNICAGRVLQKGGSCLGDSGGPVSCKADNKYYVTGITSFGPTADCLEDLIPDVYIRVSEYIEWIFSVITKYHL